MQESHIKTAEMSTEQNYNMIDGTLNNALSMGNWKPEQRPGNRFPFFDVAEAAKAEAQKPEAGPHSVQDRPAPEKAVHPGAAQSRQGGTGQETTAAGKIKANWRCKAVNKFENVDVLAALKQLMQQNTAFIAMILRLIKKPFGTGRRQRQAENKTLLWMSRPSGTYCFRERDVFLQDTRQHNTWRFYGEQTRDHILAYAVKLTGKVGGKDTGQSL